MTTLAFDTSTEILGICLRSDDKYFTYTAKAGLRHSEVLLTEIDHLYKTSGINKNTTDLIVCAKGPGSFTGLRIGMSIAKGLSAGLDKPMISVPTLDILAEAYSWFDGAVIPLLDAKSGKAFAAVYEKGVRTSEYLDILKADLGDIFSRYNRVLLTGAFAPAIAEIYRDRTNLTVDPEYCNCRILSCLRLGEKLFSEGKTDAENSGPIYIRPSEAELAMKNR